MSGTTQKHSWQGHYALVALQFPVHMHLVAGCGHVSHPHTGCNGCSDAEGDTRLAQHLWPLVLECGATLHRCLIIAHFCVRLSLACHHCSAVGETEQRFASLRGARRTEPP